MYLENLRLKKISEKLCPKKFLSQKEFTLKSYLNSKNPWFKNFWKISQI